MDRLTENTGRKWPELKLQDSLRVLSDKNKVELNSFWTSPLLRISTSLVRVKVLIIKTCSSLSLITKCESLEDLYRDLIAASVFAYRTF